MKLIIGLLAVLGLLVVGGLLLHAGHLGSQAARRGSRQADKDIAASLARIENDVRRRQEEDLNG